MVEPSRTHQCVSVENDSHGRTRYVGGERERLVRVLLSQADLCAQVLGGCEGFEREQVEANASVDKASQVVSGSPSSCWPSNAVTRDLFGGELAVMRERTHHCCHHHDYP